MDNEEIQGVKFSEFPSATPGDSDEVVGLHAGDNARFSVANFVLAIRQGLANIFVPLTRTINGKALNNDISLNASDVGAVATSAVGAVNGVASLDSAGKVPSSQLPSSTGPEPATATPLMDGTGAVGTSTKYAREDHEHPADTNKQDTITASGILKGDGAGGVSAASPGTDYQAPLTIDSTPTASSTNPVQSGGVYADVRTRVPNYGKGKNLLRNWYFVGGGTGRGVFPVNQRGQSSYSGATSVFDGWTADANTGIAFGSAGIIVSLLSGSSTNIYQRAGKAPLGQSITMSILTGNGLVTVSGVMPSRLPSNNQTVLTVGTSADGYRFRLYLQPAGTMYAEFRAYTTQTWIAAKLELGTEQTLAHQENSVWVLNDVPDYEYELYRCITSTADPNDTYANKSLATEQQLAYVETGTTASRAYAVGEYFCWNGLLYRAKTAISSGGTFTPNTNCEQVTEGGLNSITKTEVITSECVINDSVLISNNVRVSVSGNVLVISGNTKTNVNGTNVLAITLPSRLAYATRAYFYMGAYGGTFIGEGYVEDHSVRMNISASSNNGVFNVVTTLN